MHLYAQHTPKLWPSKAVLTPIYFSKNHIHFSLTTEEFNPCVVRVFTNIQGTCKKTPRFGASINRLQKCLSYARFAPTTLSAEWDRRDDLNYSAKQFQQAPHYLIEWMHFNLPGADVSQVALGVVLQVVGDGHPDGALAALDVVLEYYAGYRTAFAHTGTVAWGYKCYDDEWL